MDSKSCKLLTNYFANRHQRVKMGDTLSEWLAITKGAPQGSIMGPFVYNIFTNDLLLQLEKHMHGSVFNYADDNTVLACDDTITGVNSKLEELSRVLIEWFTQNFMQANASKFQYIMFGSSRVANCNSELKLEASVTLTVSSCVRLLGVDVDQNLLFSEHVGRINFVNTLAKS